MDVFRETTIGKSRIMPLEQCFKQHFELVFSPPQKENLKRIRAKNYEYVINNKVDSSKPLQFMIQDMHGWIMEWDLQRLLEINLQLQITQVVALRSPESMAYQGWLCINVDNPYNYWAIAQYLITLSYLHTYVVLDSFLPFPKGYSPQPLQYAIGPSRVNGAYFNSGSNFAWFVTPVLQQEYYYFPTPGCVLSPKANQNEFYFYRSGLKQFDPMNLNIQKLNKSSKDYRFLLCKKTQLFSHAFGNLESIAQKHNAMGRLRSAYKLQCLQEQRAYLVDPQITSRWFNHDQHVKHSNEP